MAKHTFSMFTMNRYHERHIRLTICDPLSSRHIIFQITDEHFSIYSPLQANVVSQKKMAQLVS